MTPSPREQQSTTIVEGLTFPEAPRWHDGALWFIEIPGHRVHRLSRDGVDEVVAELAERPASLDFLPDGEAIVALGDVLQLVRLDGTLYADLSSVMLNGQPFEKFGDMVIDGHGRAYVGCIGHRKSLDDAGRTDIDAVVLVSANGDVSIAASGGMDRPNGMAITQDGTRLIIGESLARRLCQWDIAADGTLSNLRLFAETGDDIPDGVCLDEQGAAWVAGVHTRRTIRVLEGGTVTDVVAADDNRFAIAPMLGGDSGTDLFVVTCSTPTDTLRGHPDVVAASGAVERVTVGVPRAGWPKN